MLGKTTHGSRPRADGLPVSAAARVTRRRFMRGVASLVAVPFLGSLFLLTRGLGRSRSPRRIVVATGDLTQDLTFVDDIIVCRTDSGVRVFSASCTHLGCRISQRDGELLVCPCHGSRFRLDGTVARGPAARPLDALPHSVDPATGALTVTVA